MSNEKLAEQLNMLKEACAKWEKELAIYTKWAIENDGVISASEKKEIERRKADIAAIKARIAQIEKAKGIQPKEEKSYLEQVYDSAKEIVETVVDKVKDFFDVDDDDKAPETAPAIIPANETTVETPKKHEAAAKAAELGESMLTGNHLYKNGYAGPGGYWVPEDKEKKCIPQHLWGKKIEPGQPIPPEVLKCRSVTWCNRFAMDLAEKVMGKDNPFDKLIKEKKAKAM